MKSCLPLISYLIERLADDGEEGLRLRVAFNLYGDGPVTTENVAEVLETYGEMVGEVFPPGMAISCGLTANVFCKIFTGSRTLDHENVTLGDLRSTVTTRRAQLLRINLAGHAYVIEQVSTQKDHGAPTGNIYQSNIAVLGNPDLGISLHKFLREHANPIEIDGHLDSMAKLTLSSVSVGERLEIYKALYTTPSYLENSEVKEITTDIFKADVELLQFKSAAYQIFERASVVERLRQLFSAASHESGVNEINKIALTN